MNKAKLRIWWDDHWIMLIIVVIGAITLVTTVLGLYYYFRLDSFQQQTMMATAPLYLFNSVVASLIFIVGYRFFLTGGFSKLQQKKSQR